MSQTSPVATAATAAATPLLSITLKVQAFLSVARSSAADGLTWSEFGQLLTALLRLSIETLDTVTGMTGAEKKALVLDAAAALFDLVADAAVPLPLRPLWYLIKSPVRSLVIALAGGMVEQLLPLIRSAT